jgi:FixJ family two-component response regulator
MSPGAKVFIVDDDAAVSKALMRVLTLAGFEVEAYPSAQSFLARAPHAGPACLLLDQQLPGQSGLELQRALGTRRSDQAVTIVFLTGHADVVTSVKAMKAGAFDFLSKPVDDVSLVDAVQRALEHSARLLSTVQEREQFLARVDQLTPRERQVCALIVRGMLNKEVAWEIGISEKTVKIHRARLVRKLGVGSVAELSRMVERTGPFTAPATARERETGRENA